MHEKQLVDYVSLLSIRDGSDCGHSTIQSVDMPSDLPLPWSAALSLVLKCQHEYVIRLFITRKLQNSILTFCFMSVYVVLLPLPLCGVLERHKFQVILRMMMTNLLLYEIDETVLKMTYSAHFSF